MHASAASGRRPTIAPKGSDWVVQGKGPVRHVRDTARMRPSLRGGRVSAEGPQRRCRCAQKAHMARRKELANKVNRPPRYARAGGVRQPRGEVRRVHGPHGRAQDDMASGRALVRRETQRRNRAPEETLKPLEAPPYQLCHENTPPIEKALVVQPLELDREGVFLAGALVGVVSELLLEPRHVVEWGVV